MDLGQGTEILVPFLSLRFTEVAVAGLQLVDIAITVPLSCQRLRSTLPIKVLYSWMDLGQGTEILVPFLSLRFTEVAVAGLQLVDIAITVPLSCQSEIFSSLAALHCPMTDSSLVFSPFFKVCFKSFGKPTHLF